MQQRPSLEYSTPTSTAVDHLPSRPATSHSSNMTSEASARPETLGIEYDRAFSDKQADKLLDARLDSLLELGAAQSFLRLFKAGQ